jgi:hypothetical protein
VNSRPSFPARSATPSPDEPIKHVIDVYVHRHQTITCVCGWHGSSAPDERGVSEWTTHLQAFRTRKR